MVRNLGIGVLINTVLISSVPMRIFHKPNLLTFRMLLRFPNHQKRGIISVNVNQVI